MANPYENTGTENPFKEENAHPSAQSYVPPTLPAPATPHSSGAPPATSQPPPNFGASPAAPFSATSSPPSYGGNTADYVDPAAYPSKPPPVFYDGSGGDSAPATGAMPADATAAPTASATLQPPQPTSKVWRLQFYQQFFDVDTDQVLRRMSNVLLPLTPPDFLIDRNWHYNEGADGVLPQPDAQPEGGITSSRKPDLYGPLWVCTTLWMLLGIVGNIMSKIAYNRHNTDPKKKWSYDFSVASVACIVIYLYCFVFGAAVWGVMKWKNLPASLADTLCLYGYSMFIFILTALLCMVPVSAAQWVFVVLGGLWSTSYLLLNFWHMWKVTLEHRWFIGIVVGVSAFHVLLTLSFKFYFFHYSL